MSKQSSTSQGATGKEGWNLITFLFGQRKSSEGDSFRVILIFMTFGFVAIVLTGTWISINKGDGSLWLNTIGLSVLVGLAASIAGGLLGFLFGIPRSLQREDSITQKDQDTGERYYRTNTNLEQISDWLTKIIVGVSLTQIPKLISKFDALTLKVAGGYSESFSSNFSYPFASSIMLFYFICGFLVVYLWAKLYLLEQLVKMEDNLYKRKFQKQVEKVSKLEIARLSSLLTGFNRTRNKILAAERDEKYVAVVEKAKPEIPVYIEDFQKGRWGGKSKVGNYSINANVTENKDGVNPFKVVVTVKAIAEEPALKGKVYFFLHDTFAPYIEIVEATNNSATVSFESYEAFTVGAVINGGEIKLELDLNTLVDCPDDYKYTGPLATIDDVKDELDQLKKAQEEYDKNKALSSSNDDH